MTFVKLEQNGVNLRRRRLLISGEPNTRKTTALVTLLAHVQAQDPTAKLAILSYPGEKGYDTIPVDNPAILPFIWSTEASAKKQNPQDIVNDVINTSIDIIAGKYGNVKAFAGDGLHKFYDYIMDSVTDGALFAGDDFEAKLYKRGEEVFKDYLSRTMHTAIPIVAFTTWAEPEKDRFKRPGEKDGDIPAHIYPALPGKVAKKIMGEFSIIVHQTLRKLKPNDDELVAVWQTRPYGDVWGAGLKGPAEVVKRIPTFIPADYSTFERIWTDAEKAATSATPSAS